jgi:NADH-quinone oxidoreductase subunit N
LVFAVLLLAQAGIPFTSGFFAKFTVIGAAVDAEEVWLAIVAMVTAVIAAFLYLRIVAAMYMSGGEHGDEVADVPEAGPVRVPAAAALGLAVCFGVTLLAGILPSLVLDPAREGRPALVREPVAVDAVTDAGTGPDGLPTGSASGS